MNLPEPEVKRADYLEVDGRSMTIAQVSLIARGKVNAFISKETVERVRASRKVVEKIVREGRTAYGINTGFGKFSEIVVPKEDLLRLQNNLIASHATAVGRPLDEEVVRAIMILRANALARGYSGVRPKVIEMLLKMLNRGVHPLIPAQGSLGASGDLAPLAHMALVMTGRGEAIFKGKRMDGAAALNAAGLEPLTLQEKEGLALINGTQVMTALAALAVHDALNLLKAADIISALTLEALEALPEPFDIQLWEARPHPGHKATLENLESLLQGSAWIGRKHKVQDAYSLRCIPQVHGAAKDALRYIKSVIDIEINSATDNPLVFPEGERILSGGNFHGQPVSQAMDFFCMAVAELGSISERRVERMLNSSLSGLPPFLARQGGLNSGFMIAQYTAASIASENKIYAHPASVDSISCSASQEDHVSMGTTAARKARQVVQNIAYILAVELLVAAQAIEINGSSDLGIGSARALSYLRRYIPPLAEDRILYPDLEKAASLISSGCLVKHVEEKVNLTAL
ncbi:MAG: histidine ammonia-lyase [Dethiobacteria bacterium]|jgi:histidine ammonia-lyase|nr:histidine ammonia-lyase [Bacillota bacterium]